MEVARSGNLLDRSLASASNRYRDEIKALAEGLPFTPIELPEYRKRSFEPEKIRQERTFSRPDSSTQSITRFLVERGTVEILKPEMTQALFTEMHWCGFELLKLTRKRWTSDKEIKDGVVTARKLVSRMEAAEEELFIANRRLVVSCVKPFYWIGQAWISDFLQEGSKALSNAIRKFDFTRGTPFYAYAQKSIQNRLRNFFRDHIRSGSLGIRPTEDMRKIKAAMDQWKDEHGDDAPPNMLAQMTEIPEEKIRKLRPLINQWQRMPSPPVSLDAMIGESTSSMHELVEDGSADIAFIATEKAEIWQAVEKLPERAQYILRLRFLEGRTLEETGQMLDLTRARIKQIQDDSLRKLRQILRRGIDDPKM